MLKNWRGIGLATAGSLALPLVLGWAVSIPAAGYALAGLAVAAVAGGIVETAREWRRLDRSLEGRCARCGYDLRGHAAPGGRCPECGAEFGIDLPTPPAQAAPPAAGAAVPRANVEIKARARDLPVLERAAAELSGGPPTVLHQCDTFFPCPSGRLKVRRLGPTHGELINYHRADVVGPKRSDYSIVRTDAPDALAAQLGEALGVAGVVRKERRLYLIGRTRVHLDRVEGLGDFVELEVVLTPGESAADGRAVAAELMRRLGIDDGDLVPGAYIDLLLAPRV